MTSPDSDRDTDSEPLDVRPPQQRRSRAAWSRVLDSGVVILEEGGYEAFTIAAVCERAGVAPRALYARVDSKDALFLAVYEHGLARVRSDQQIFAEEEHWAGLSADQVADQVVHDVAQIFGRHAALLRAVVLIAGVHPEVNRRGARYSQELGDVVTARLLRLRDQIDQPDPPSAVRAAFNVVFAALVLRVAYGPAFATPAADDETFLQTLSAMVRRYLFEA